MNLQEELKVLKQRIAELEEQVKEEQEFPQYMDTYYYIQSSGRVDWSNWDDDDISLLQQRLGNVFQTEQQAEFAVEKLKVEAELRKFSRPFKKGGSNHFMVIDTENGSLDIWCRVYSKYQGTVYFESVEKAQQAVNKVGSDRIKKYIFGAED